MSRVHRERLIRIPGLLALTLAALIALAARPAVAQTDSAQPQRIAAVVNDDVISVFDVENRITLVMATSGMPNTPDVRARLRPQVIRTLIDERLEIQEATRINALVSQKEIDDAIGRIERANRMPSGALLPAMARDGVDASSLMNQIKAGLSWQKVVARRLRPSLDVGNDEIDEVLDRITAEKGTTEYLLAELFLSIESPDQEDEVRDRLNQMLEQMRRGTSFAAIAQQFSQAASASQGGDIGWVERGQLDDDVAKQIEELEPNHATPPIRTPTGFYVYLLRDKRVLAAANPEDSTVTLAQLVLPLEPGATADEIESQKSLAQTVRETVAGCDDLKQAADELHVPYPDPTPDLKVRDLNPTIRPVVLNLKVGEAAAPLQSESSIALVMVCARKDPPVQMPSREDISENLTRQRLDLIARRYLADLRRQAFIDMRV
jgi:peptidyl-prolyl cis-trans isomerase SurA